MCKSAVTLLSRITFNSSASSSTKSWQRSKPKSSWHLLTRTCPLSPWRSRRMSRLRPYSTSWNPVIKLAFEICWLQVRNRSKPGSQTCSITQQKIASMCLQWSPESRKRTTASGMPISFASIIFRLDYRSTRNSKMSMYQIIRVKLQRPSWLRLTRSQLFSATRRRISRTRVQKRVQVLLSSLHVIRLWELLSCMLQRHSCQLRLRARIVRNAIIGFPSSTSFPRWMDMVLWLRNKPKTQSPGQKSIVHQTCAKFSKSSAIIPKENSDTPCCLLREGSYPNSS